MENVWIVLTREDRVAAALASLKHEADSEASLPDGPFPESPTANPWSRKYQRALPLVEAKDYDAFQEVLGQDNVTQWGCDNCSVLHNTVIVLHEDDESRYQACEGCLASALASLRDAKKSQASKS